MNENDIFELCKEHKHEYTYVESCVRIEGDYISEVEWHCCFFGSAPDELITDCLQNSYDIEVDCSGYYIIKALLSTHSDHYDYGRTEEWLEIEKIELEYQYSLEEMEAETPSLGCDLFKIFLDK